MPSAAGSFLYHGLYRPIGMLRNSLAAGGPVAQWRTARGRRAMEAATSALPVPLCTTHAEPVVLYLLSGRKFWYQSVFCLWTFSYRSNRQVQPIIFDDGTLEQPLRAPFQRLFPGVQFVDADAATARFHTILPPARFPYLHNRWAVYPNLRKLIAPHVAGGGWKLVLDSDLLFFRRPEFILQWHDRPDRPLHAVDTVTSYGYTRRLLEQLAGRPVAELVNVGLCGLQSDQLDWERIEGWCRTLIEREGSHYFLEQALVALLVAGRECAIAPAPEYVTLPRPPEADDCRAVMHHYVAESKHCYFRRNWRRALE